MDNIEKLVLDKFEQSLLSVDRLAAAQILADSLKENDPVYISDKIICPALDRIGEKWEKEETALSQVYMSGIICEEMVNSLFSDLDLSKDKSVPVAIVTFEDYHILGKQIVKSILKSGEFMFMILVRESMQTNLYKRSGKIKSVSSLFQP